MPDDVSTVVLCELAERVLAMRAILDDPAVTAKSHARAVGALIGRGLTAIEERLAEIVQRPVLLPDTLGATYDCAIALRALERRLSMLERRWNTAPVDIFLRKLHDEAGPLVHPAVVLCDDEVVFDDDIVEHLYSDLAAAGLILDDVEGEAPILAMPRLDVANPLVWPLLLRGLARLQARAQGLSAGADVLNAEAARWGGPSVFAARAAYLLTVTPPARPVWPALASLAAAASAHVGGLEGGAAADLEQAGAIALFTRLVRDRDRALGHAVPERPAVTVDTTGGQLRSLLPTAAQAAALLDKLVAGVPINALEPTLADDFVERLQSVDSTAAFYDLIAPLAEQPASLAAILGVGWLYKIRHGYAGFRAGLHDGSFPAALAWYRTHTDARNALLLQSIEAAHVQSMFVAGSIDR